MKTLILKLIAIIPFFFGGFVFAQNYNMSNGSITACSGTFYDSGGSGGAYGANQLYTFTICPSTPGSKVTVNFTSFNIEDSWDFFTVYDGPNTSAPTLGTYTGVVGPGLASASPSNTSGCLTFVFDSDGSVNNAGWAGTIACTSPCQTVTANLVSTSPAASAGIIRICQGGSVSFVGSGTFSSSGAGATYSWNFGDGTSGSGTNVSHSYAAAGSYQASLTVTDNAGCVSQNSASVIIQVSTTPTIVTGVSPNPICLGQSANLTANVTMTPFVPNCTPPVSGTTFLPDGSGVSYTTSINVNCFNASQTVTAASNITNVCLSLEHSYLGDLNIVLICPNGQSMVLKAYPGGNGTYLGSPLDDPTVGPGTGWNYCFTPTASTLLVNGPTSSAGSPTGNSIQAGNYMPVQPFTNLIGCPLNGNWTIQVTDNLGSDNGYIFNWDVNFSVPPATGSFTPTIASQGWVASPTLTSTGATTATVTPTAAGSPCYTYSVTDNFGCTYTANQCLTVNPNVPVNAGPDVSGCPGSNVTIGGAPSGPAGMTYSWVETTTNPNIAISGSATVANPTVAISAGATGSATYTVTGTSAGCVTTDVVVVTVVPPPATNAGLDQTVCVGGSATLTASGATTYSWSPSTGLSGTTGATVTSTPAATITYTVTGTTGTCTSTDQVTVTVNPVATANANIDQTLCVGGTATLAGSVGGSATGGTWTASTGSFSNANSLTSTYTPTITSGSITLTLTSDDPTGPCPAVTDQMVITVNPVATVNANVDQSVCAGGSVTLAGSIGGSATSATWTASSGTFSNASSLTSTYTPSITSGTITLTLTTNDPAGPCTSVLDQMVITVNPLPTVTVNSPTVCTGNPATVTATPVPAGSYNYAWTVPGGASAPGNVATFSTTTAGTYSVIITNPTTTCSSTSASGTVTLNPLPTVTVNSPSVCAGTPATVTATPGSAGTFSYAWTVPAGATAPGNVATFSTTVAGTYSVIITNTTTLCVSASASGTVTVNALPIVVANDVSVCAGGSVTITASGANTYTWSPTTYLNTTSGSSVISTPPSNITYTVSGTSLAGCVNTDPVTVSVSGSAPINAGPDVSICMGASTTITATGGSTYNWAGLGTNASYSVSPAATTTYTVTGTDASGCVGTDAMTVTVNPVPTVTVNSPTVCEGTPATVTATPGGAGTYSYAWTVPVGATAPGNVATFTTTTAGTYSVTITNTTTNCVSTSASGTVTINPLPTATVNSPTVCAGSTATVTASPGVAGTYSFAWTVPAGATNPGNVATFTATVSGTYSVVLTNTTTLCVSTSASGTVTINPVPTVTVNSPTVCGGSGATVTATPGSAGTYSYAWTVPAGATAPGNVATFSTTISGTYSVIITNTTTSCSSTSASGTVTLNPIPTVTVNSPTVCAGTPATVTATPGTAGTYSYAWTVPAGATAPGNVASFSTNTAGTYSVIITNTTTSCVSTSASGTVTINPLPTATVNSPTVCAGTTATVTATPGVAGTYNYAWTVPAGATNPGNASSFTATVSGTYSVILTNPTTSCVSSSASGVATINPIPVITLAPTDPTTCNGTNGFITVNGSGTGTVSWTGAATGSTPGVTLPYNISTLSSGNYNVIFTVTSTGCVSSSVSTTLNNPGAPVINAMPNLSTCGTSITILESNVTGTNLTSNLGFYSSPGGVGPIADGTTYNSPTPTTTIYVYDVNGVCTAQVSFTVTVNPIPTVTVNSPTVCAGANATVTATPGTAGTYSYAWTVPAGATNPGNVASFSTTTAGTFSVIITNTATSCVSTSASGTVTVNPLPTVTVNSPVICAGATATVTASPGTAATYSYAWTVQAGVPNPGNVASFTTTTAGTYSVIITNTTTTCVSVSASGTVTVNPLPTATVNSPTVCAGTPATVTASPGVAGTYSFAWTVPAGATNPGNVATFNTTTAGTYSVILTNTTTSCVSASASGTVTVNPLPTVTVNSPTVCAGTPANVVATPGTAGTYSYAWTVPAGATAPGNVASFNTSISGTYSVIITNTTTSCVSASASGVATINPNPTVTVNSSTVCAGTSATVTATPGSAGTYSYAWSVPAGAGAPGNLASFSTTTAGTYSVIITNTTTSCFSPSASGTVIVNPLPTATITGTVTVCQGQPQPTVTLTGANGTSPYTFTYNINNGPNLTITSTGNTATINVSTSSAGTFAYNLVSVQDASSTGCSQLQSGTATVTVNPLPTATISGSAVVCEGGANQTITFTGANGTAPYTFTYNLNGGAVQTITSTGNTATITVSSTTPGTFTYNLVSVQDASATGCSQAQPGVATVTVNPTPNVSAGMDLTICDGETVILTGSGANNYTWDYSVVNGIGFQPALGTTTYTVTGTSAAGCTNTDQVDVIVNPIPVVSFTADTTLGCVPLLVTFTNTTPNSSNCVWTMSDGTVLTGCTTVSNIFDQAGCFDITLTTTSMNGCVNSFTATNFICVEEPPIAAFSPSESVISEFDTEVNFENNTQGATSYIWTFGDDSAGSTDENPSHDYANNEIGNYIVTLIAISPLGCTDTATSTIQIYEEVIFYVPNTFTPDFDTYNQTFKPIFTSGFDPLDYSLFIYNRWGELIFESHNSEIGWDGSYGSNHETDMVQEGVYTWKIEFKTTATDERRFEIGHVTMLK